MKLFTGIFLISTVQVWAQVSPAINQTPTREFGHAKLGITLTAQPNLVEGRELNQPTSIAFDNSVSPPIVYIADISNHRILAWKNPASLTDGTKYADKVIGQRDFYSSQANGPGCSNCLTSGLNTPTAIAVDKAGNLYVADNGNNRILRFPKPFQQTGDIVQPDLVLGQKVFSAGNLPNRGLTGPSNITLALSANGISALSGLAFDPQGNLWVTDSLNNRVLRYPSAKLQADPTADIAADLVLGQTTFTNNAAPTGADNIQTNLQALPNPNGLTFDSQGRLYVADSFARVMYFANPTTNGTFATRILGIQPAAAQGTSSPPYPTAYTLGNVNSGGTIVSFPRGLFTLGNVLFVCDPGQNRIVRYDTPENWPAATATAPSPAAVAVYGQDDFVSGKPNRGATQPGTSSFWEPTAGAFFGNEMWVVDNKNNRVLGFAQGGAFQYLNASRLIGQQRFDVGAPNLIEGRELFVFSSGYHGSSIVVDRNSTPNHVYVADSANNRILGFNDVNKVGVDARSLLTTPADLVIGQTDFYHSLPNSPGGDSQIPTVTGLLLPSGLSLDPSGNLYVADTGNGRVLRFPAPFSPSNSAQRANLVLGQSSFSQRITDASNSTMGAPFGVVVFNNGGLAVSDILHNRILIFRKGSGDFINGQSAGTVLGQQNFNAIGSGTTPATLNGPRGLAVDSGDRLFVADTLNNRVLVYTNTPVINNGASGLVIPGFNQPEGVAVSPTSGETWVADFGTNRVIRLKEFSALQLDPANAVTATIASQSNPIGLALDAFDNVLVVEASNRITFYYAQLFYQQTATYSFGNSVLSSFGPRIAPNTIVALRRLGRGFDFSNVSTAGIPYPKELGGLQILVEGIPAPIYYVGPYDATGGAMYFIVPNNAPSSGRAEYMVRRTATGETLGAGYFDMVPAAPGLYTKSQDGTGQAAAVNNDTGTPQLNGPADETHSPVARGSIISLYLTGIGHIDNAPPDGQAPNGQFNSPLPVKVVIGGLTVPDSYVYYSGFSYEFPGLWQLNVKIPDSASPVGGVVPGNKVSVVVTLQDLPSNIGGSPGIGTDRTLQLGPTTIPGLPSGNGLIPTIAVK